MQWEAGDKARKQSNQGRNNLNLECCCCSHRGSPVMNILSLRRSAEDGKCWDSKPSCLHLVYLLASWIWNKGRAEGDSKNTSDFRSEKAGFAGHLYNFKEHAWSIPYPNPLTTNRSLGRLLCSLRRQSGNLPFASLHHLHPASVNLFLYCLLSESTRYMDCSGTITGLN